MSPTARAVRVHLVLASCTVLLAMLALLNWVVFPLPKDKLFRQASTFVFSREGHLLNRFTSSDQYWRKPVRLEQVSPLLVNSVLNVEDRWFYWHPGVNPVSLALAAIDNVRSGRIIRGGSTITMQIARMMEPKERTIPNKMLEILRALQLEINYSKDELLELYLNVAPYGGNIEGIGAASYLYFDKPPSDLSLSEVAILTMLPSSPTRFRPDRDLAQCTKRRDEILARLKDDGVVSEEDYRQAVQEEIPSDRVSPPIAAPHFSQMLTKAHKGEFDIRSTLDYSLQMACERMACQYQLDLAMKGINNLSLVVLDNRSASVLALVGSSDFGDVAHQGQINGALARRSPGSALKPFVYALGIDKGIITPGLKIEDLPINYAGYVPVNFDEEYHGVVAVSEALIQSLNVPAVNLTARVGLKNVYDKLCAGGISTLNRKHFDYGLPMILGSCEVNLLELSNLYATVARGGSYIPLHTTLDSSDTPAVRIFSPEASYLVTEILAELKRPDLPSCWEFTAGLPRVAWKTGTSFGRKDAWAIGYDPTYTVGVWAGNFSAEGSIAIVGAEVSAPLMLDIFNLLYPNGQAGWFHAPSGVGERMVCASSGQVAGESCPDRVAENYVVGVSSNASCSVHRSLLVDDVSGYALCKFCAPGKHMHEVALEEWPPRVAAWLGARGMLDLIPPHNPECTGALAGETPIITSPENDAVYVIRPSAPLDYQQILFQASVAVDGQQALWFLDGELYARATPDRGVFYLPEPGSHELVCVDSYGRSSKIVFRVQYPEQRYE